MLGKHKTRASSFSMLHATALIAALGIAALIGPSIEHAGTTSSIQVSKSVTIEATSPYAIIRATAIRMWDCETAEKEIDV